MTQMHANIACRPDPLRLLYAIGDCAGFAIVSGIWLPIVRPVVSIGVHLRNNVVLPLVA
jgi:hypothetical protein